MTPLALAVKIFMEFDRTTTGYQFVERVPWIRTFNIDYFVGIDGISVTMVLLTALLCFICIFLSAPLSEMVRHNAHCSIRDSTHNAI